MQRELPEGSKTGITFYLSLIKDNTKGFRVCSPGHITYSYGPEGLICLGTNAS